MITLTDKAVSQIKSLREAQGNPDLMLRIQVNGGGCQGFEYEIKTDTVRLDDDHAFEKDGVCVLIDAVSLPFLDGANIDFVDDLIGAQFKISNPNASSSCGCGTSFSV